jgi:transposase
MRQKCLVPNMAEVALVCLRAQGGAIQMQLQTCRASSTCPACGTASRRIHSRYRRKLADLPWEGLPVVILLDARKFFCAEDSCRQKIFTERLPATVDRYARRSCRSSEALNWLTLALGGRAGARLACRLGLLASRSTLLRELHHQAAVAPITTPRVLGIDDWAWKKGHRYGTILCDLEKHRVVDLLPNREAASVTKWLRQHPGVEIVSRDRGGIYAEAARKGAPRAIQVADRWHLLRNLSEALRHALAPHHRLFSQAARAGRIADAPSTPTSVPPWSEREWQIQQANRQRRYERWQQVRELLKTGASDRELGRQLNLDHRTVRKFRNAEVYPDVVPRVRQSIVDEYGTYLDQRLAEGCRSPARLWRELRRQGFCGQVNSVRYWLRQRRSCQPRAPSTSPPRPALRASPRQVVWFMLKSTPSAKDFLEEVYQASPGIARIAQLAQGFFRIVRERNIQALIPWIQAAKQTALAGFASRLERDMEAAKAALTLPWSQGHVEGQVHRLKLIKRQMYGRAGFGLLRLRVLNHA